MSDVACQLKFFRPPKVLLAEDHAVTGRIVTLLLEKAGCQVEWVENGEDALKAAQERAYDLIFMDCLMPRLDGFDAAALIRRLPTSHNQLVPIIALTATLEKEDQVRCLEYGMSDVLSKPVSLDTLQSTVQKWMFRN